jgi:tetratricopeptide (TPR) repeat protein
MKKNKIYLLLAAFLGVAVLLVAFRYNSVRNAQESRIYDLLPRTGADASSAEWTGVRTKVSGYMSELQADPANVKANLALAAVFIQEARVTGNHVYYDKAALKHVNDALKADPANFSALCYKSLLYLSQHHFAEGLQIGQQAQAINPHNAFIYGLLTDAYVELGNYKGAVEMSDKMESVKPDIRSYSRASYLREIYGDYPGAIEAMKLAVAAGPAGTEGTEWARMQLGHLYELTGMIKQADSVYRLSLDYRPGYAYAYSGLARVSIAQKKYSQAASYYLQADSMVTDNSFKEELADLYFYMKRDEEAKRITESIIQQLAKDAGDANADESIGHYSDNELALNYLKIGDLDAAATHAAMEYNRRPDNITVNETMAWVYYKKGNSKKALEHIKVAMKTGSRNPSLLCHAGLIYAQTGDKVMAKQLLTTALDHGASFNVLLESEATKQLQLLRP